MPMNIFRHSRASHSIPLRARACVLALALAACATPPTERVGLLSDQDAEALYLKRFNSLTDGASGGVGLGGYDTLEPLKGADEPSSFPVEAAASLSQSALATAREYVDGRNTSAFIVWRNGVIEQETY